MNMKPNILILAALLLLTGCAGKQSTDRKEKNVITVTIEPLRYFTEAIAGTHFKVVSMVPKGVSPETYDPTPRQLIQLADSRAYFRIGHIGFEQTWMDKLTANAPQMKVYDTSRGIDFIHAEGHWHGEHYHQGGVEPHVWNAPENVRVITQNILNALIELDSEHEAYYKERHHTFGKEIERTDSIVRSMLSAKADRAFMIYHPALSYFARAYGLRQIAIEKDGREPSPAYLKELIDTNRKEQIRIIFVQPEFALHNAELIAKETGTQIVRINPLDYYWHEEMIRTAKALCHE